MMTMIIVTSVRNGNTGQHEHSTITVVVVGSGNTLMVTAAHVAVAVMAAVVHRPIIGISTTMPAFSVVSRSSRATPPLSCWG